MSKTYFGVDISEHNGSVDWLKVAKKVDFAILRIGWVGNNENKLDERFEENYKAAKKAGVKLGAYVYMYSKSTTAAKAGADWVLSQIKGKAFELPIYCDMEDRSLSSYTATALTAIAETFIKKVNSGGFNVGIYASRYWFDYKLDKSILGYHTWIADYSSGTNKYKNEYEMWQNSSKGKVDGVKGDVDTNYLYADIFAKKSTSKSSTKKSVDEIAKEVLNGVWGDGDERKKRIQAAGYDYSAVQKKVNELLAQSEKVSYKTVIGNKYKLKKKTTLYSKGNLSGTKYEYLKDTSVTVVGHYSAKVDKIKVEKTGRVAFCEVSAFV